MFNGKIIEKSNSSNYDTLFTFEQWKQLSFTDLQRQNHNGETYLLNEKGNEMFRLTQYALQKAIFLLNHSDYLEVKMLLHEKNIAYTLNCYPPYYFNSKQIHWLYEVSFDIFHNIKAVKSFELIEFGATYGKVKINGIEAIISHSGGTLQDVRFPNVKWFDFASCLNFAKQKEGFQILKSLI